MNTLAASETLRLDRNEGNFLLPPAPREELRQLAGSLDYHRTPDPQSRELRSALSRFLQVPAQTLQVFNHQGEFFARLRLAFPTPPRVLALDSASSNLERLSLWGCDVRRVTLKQEGRVFSFDEDAFLDEIARFSPEVILLDTPNDPTGLRISSEVLCRLVGLCPSTSLFVVDESYGEFAEASLLTSFAPKGIPDKLVVLRSFSYAWGLSALQACYSIWGNQARDLVERTPGLGEPLDGLNQAFLSHLVNHYEEWMNSRVYSIRYLRDELVRRVREIPRWEAFPSEGSFVLLRGTDVTRSDLEATLQNQGIQVFFPDRFPEDATWLRVSVGKEEEIRRLLSVLVSWNQGEQGLEDHADIQGEMTA